MNNELRSVIEEIATHAPRGGGQWQNVGMKAVPVRLLTRLRELLAREEAEG